MIKLKTVDGQIKVKTHCSSLEETVNETLSAIMALCTSLSDLMEKEGLPREIVLTAIGMTLMEFEEKEGKKGNGNH